MQIMHIARNGLRRGRDGKWVASARQPQAALFKLLPPEHRQARFPRAHKRVLRQLDVRRRRVVACNRC